MDELIPVDPLENQHEIRSVFSLREPLYILFKRKRQIVSVFAATLALVVVASYVLPRSYESSARVYVERHVPPFASSGAPQSFFMALDRKEVLNSEVDFIQSRAVAEGVVERLERDRGPSTGAPRRRSIFRRMRDGYRGALVAVGLTDAPGDEREGLIASIQSRIKAEPALQSNTITISYRGGDPNYVFRIVETATEVYLVERLKLMKRPGLDAFYDEHIRRSEALLVELEKEEAALKEDTGIVSVNEEIDLKLDELSELEAIRNAAQVESGELSRRITSLEAQIAAEPETVLASRLVQQNPAVVELEQKKRELLDLRATELTRFKPGSPPVRELDDRIAALDAAIAAEPRTSLSSESVATNNTKSQLQAELYAAQANYAASRASEEGITVQIDRLKRDLRNLDRKSIELNRLAGSISSAERIYYNYKEQREEARIEANTDPSTANVKIIHHATVPSRPRFNRLTLISFGLVTGLGLGLGWALLSEFFDHSICTREDVERHLGLPFIGSLPESDSVARPL